MPPTCGPTGGPGANRTRDTRFRRAVLYPLSYEAVPPRVYGPATAPREPVCGTGHPHCETPFALWRPAETSSR